MLSLRKIAKTSVMLLALVLVTSVTAIASPITFNTLDPNFHGTVGEARQIGSALISVGYWQVGAGPRQAAMASTVGGVTTYSLFTIPQFNGLTAPSSFATGLAADGTVSISTVYVGQGDRAVRSNVLTPGSSTVISSGTGGGNSYLVNGITGSGTIYGSNYSVITGGSSTFSLLPTGTLGGGEVFDGRTSASGDRLVGNGADDNFRLISWLNGSIEQTNNCGLRYCAPGRLDFNGNPYASITYGDTFGIWNISANSLILPSFNFGAGAYSRGLWVDSDDIRMFYVSANTLGIYSNNAGTGVGWNSYCAANPTFCATVATLATDIGKGNTNGINWTADISGNSYQTINNAGGSAIPEPSTFVLSGASLLLIGWYALQTRRGIQRL